MNAIEIIECTTAINSGKKAFTNSVYVRDYIVSWYAKWDTIILTEKAIGGFYIWNPKKYDSINNHK